MIKKSKWRWVRCIWHDTVDLLMWLVTIGLFVFSLIKSPYPVSERWTIGDVSPFLFVLVFYIYYFMYRKFTFWQDRRKFFVHLLKNNQDPHSILDKYDDI